MVRVLTSHSAAASSGVIMPLGLVHLSQLFCGETNGRLMITTWRLLTATLMLLSPLFTLVSVSSFCCPMLGPGPTISARAQGLVNRGSFAAGVESKRMTGGKYLTSY